jgi:hypothetical protein
MLSWVIVFKIREASSRVAVVQQLEDVEAARCAREGDKAVTVVFEVGEASSRVTRELEMSRSCDTRIRRCGSSRRATG